MTRHARALCIALLLCALGGCAAPDATSSGGGGGTGASNDDAFGDAPARPSEEEERR